MMSCLADSTESMTSWISASLAAVSQAVAASNARAPDTVLESRICTFTVETAFRAASAATRAESYEALNPADSVRQSTESTLRAAAWMACNQRVGSGAATEIRWFGFESTTR